MANMINRIFLVLSLICTLSFGLVANSSGTIATIIPVSDFENGGNGSYTIIQLNGVNNLAECDKGDRGSGDLNFFQILSSETAIISTILTAKTTGLSIKVRWDSTNKLFGQCRIRYITLN